MAGGPIDLDRQKRRALSRAGPPAGRVVAAKRRVIGTVVDGEGHEGSGFPSSHEKDFDIIRTADGEVAQGSIWWVASVGVTAVGGLLYWSLAARFTTRGNVGLASGLFTIFLVTNYLTSMGLPVAVARFCIGATNSARALFNLAVIYTAVTSVVGALAVIGAALLLQPERSGEFLALIRERGAGAFMIFALLVVGQSLAVLVEVRLVTLRMWRWVFIRVVAVAALRVPLLWVDRLAGDPLGLFVIMAGLPALSGVVGVLLLRYTTPAGDRVPIIPLPPGTWGAFRFATINYFGLLAAQGPTFLIPLFVSTQLDKDIYGPFYLAWTITTVVFSIPYVIGQVVLAEGSRDEERVAHRARLRRQVRTGLGVAVGLMAAAAVGAFLLAEVGTRVLFGEKFPDTAVVLPRLVGAGVPWAVTAICLAYVRVHERGVATVVITVSFALCTIVPSTLLVSRNGIAGAADGWLLGNVVAAAIAVVVTLGMTRRERIDLVGFPAPSHDLAAD